VPARVIEFGNSNPVGKVAAALGPVIHMAASYVRCVLESRPKELDGALAPHPCLQSH